MKWQDERWIKLYTRNTPRWLALPWQAKCILPLLMRVVDRDGVFDCEGLEPDEAVSTAVGVPVDIVTEGLRALEESRAVTRCHAGLTIPNFPEAQETPSSAAERKRRQRERENPVKQDTMSRAVTRCHGESLTEQTRQDRTEETDPPQPPRGASVSAAVGVRSGSEPRGTRLAADWKPSAETLEWAKSEGLDALAALPEFIDHWLSVPGARGRKIDWDRTFRNRLRDLQARRKDRASGTYRNGRVPLQQPGPDGPLWKSEVEF